jgi:uncharacterized membrane protein YozB (DUF420 family)
MSTALSEATESPLARRVIGALSVFLILTVAVVIYAGPGRHTPGAPGMLPTLNAILNASASVFLILGWIFIRRRDFRSHKRCMLTAAGISTLFLVSYLAHHAQAGSVPFRGPPGLRAVYFAILIPHIVLATAIVPLALFTIYRGLRGRFEAHKKIARVTLPLWLYVSLSGVAVYFMLYHLPD